MKLIMVAAFAVLAVAGTAMAQGTTDSAEGNSSNSNRAREFRGSPGTQADSPAYRGERAGGGGNAPDSPEARDGNLGGPNPPQGDNQTGNTSRRTPQESVREGEK